MTSPVSQLPTLQRSPVSMPTLGFGKASPETARFGEILPKNGCSSGFLTKNNRFGKSGKTHATKGEIARSQVESAAFHHIAPPRCQRNKETADLLSTKNNTKIGRLSKKPTLWHPHETQASRFPRSIDRRLFWNHSPTE